MYCTNPECPDLVATGRSGEYVDGVVECPICGAALVARPDEDLHDGAAADPRSEGLAGDGGASELEPVFQTDDPAEVPIVRALLESAEIPVHVQGESQWDGFRGGLSAFRFANRGPRILFLVPSQLADEARAMLEQIDDEGEEPGCPPVGCGGRCHG